MLGIIGWRMTKSKVAGGVLALLLLVNGQLFRVHTLAMSEPLYIFFTLAAFLSFWHYFSEEQNKLTAKSAKDANEPKNLGALRVLRGSNGFSSPCPPSSQPLLT